MGHIYQSHLCCCLDNTSPSLAFTSTSTAASGCSMPRPAELVPVSPCSCPPRGLQLFHSQVNCISKIVLAKCNFWLSLRSHFTSQERTCKYTFAFHSEVTSPLKNVIANPLLTFTQKSVHLSRMCLQMHFWLSLRSHFTSQECACKCTSDFHSQVTLLRSSSHSGRLATVALVSFVAQSSCSCKLDTTIRCHTSCCARCPLWTWFCSWCSICSDTATRCHTSYWTGSHSTLSYLVCGASSGSLSPFLLPGATLLK